MDKIIDYEPATPKPVVTEELLGRLEELMEEAAPGPWQMGYNVWGADVRNAHHDEFILENKAWEPSEVTLEFIVAARQYLPELIAEVRRLRKE